MIQEEILKTLHNFQDIPYRDFQSALIPNIKKERFIGVRTPQLRLLAKDYAKREDIGAFLSSLPHSTFDENQLHAFILSEMKDFDVCIRKLQNFLPYIDNWATCDQLSPKVFRKHKAELLMYIDRFLSSDHPYTVRFGIGMLMQHFSDEDFSPAYPEKVCRVCSDDYYVRMMTAWYFATLLAKQYDAALPYLLKHRLDTWTHNKALQKAIESRRITDEQKAFLKTLKRKST